MLIDCNMLEEAFYLSGILNSSLSRYVAISYAVEIQYDPHLLQNIRIPKFELGRTDHIKLAELSKEMHKAIEVGNTETLREFEEEIDELAACIWGLTPDELREIQLSLQELS